MSREYDIFSEDDFNKMTSQFRDYFRIRKQRGLDFQRIKIISKRWTKSKSSKQHRKYFALLSKYKELLIDAGYELNEEDCHAYIKLRSGFTKIIDAQVIPKSIADKSEEATSENLKFLIDFVIRTAAQDFDVNLEEGF